MLFVAVPKQRESANFTKKNQITNIFHSNFIQFFTLYSDLLEFAIEFVHKVYRRKCCFRPLSCTIVLNAARHTHWIFRLFLYVSLFDVQLWPVCVCASEYVCARAFVHVCVRVCGKQRKRWTANNNNNNKNSTNTRSCSVHTRSLHSP